MRHRLVALASLFVVSTHMGACAMDRIEAEMPLLTFSKQTAPESESLIGGQVVRSPGYEYGELLVYNRLTEPIVLEWNIHVRQNFTPIVRSSAGEVVSDGRPFGISGSPSAEASKHVVAPGEKHTIKLAGLFETVPRGKRKPGIYCIRVRFLAVAADGHGLGIWESNEISVQLNENEE